MKKWMVYFMNSEGMRDGNEYIYAYDKEEALVLYKRHFNVNQDCRVVAVFDGASVENRRSC